MIESVRSERKHGAAWATIAFNAAFACIVVFNVIRALRHAMWRDEFQPWLRALEANQSYWDLLQNLKYDAHPPLWYTVAWLITRVTDNPFWFQLVHVGLAIMTSIIIYRWSSFERIEKILLLLSYFLFFEYFVITRSYMLVALLGFAFVAVRQARPQDDFVPWVLLGLLADTVAHATVWSISLAAMLVLRRASFRPAFLLGGSFYAVCLAIAALTMRHDPYDVSGYDFQSAVSRLDAVVVIPIGAFVPLRPDWIMDTIRYLSDMGAAPVPHYWNANPYADILALTHADSGHPFRLAALLAAPIVACWLIVRTPLRVLEFSMTYIGMLLFADIWNFVGSARHHGIVFLALIACAWESRAERPADMWSRWMLRTLLIVSACGGILTLTSELRPFSRGRDAAAWISENNLLDANIIGLRLAETMSVTGYLHRPVYSLRCDCLATHQSIPLPKMSGEPLGRRLLRAIEFGAPREPILIINHPLTDEERTDAAEISFTLAKAFEGAETNEDVWIYRMSRKPRSD